MEHPLTKADAEALIRKIASLPAGVSYRDHCLERMRERNIDALDVVRVLRNAVLVSRAYRRSGEWRYRVRERPGNASPWRRDMNFRAIPSIDDGGGEHHEVPRVRQG